MVLCMRKGQGSDKRDRSGITAGYLVLACQRLEGLHTKKKSCILKNKHLWTFGLKQWKSFSRLSVITCGIQVWTLDFLQLLQMLQGFLGNPVNGFWVVCLIVLCKIKQEKQSSEQHVGRASPERMRTWFMSPMPSLTKCPTPQISDLTIELLENMPWFLTKGLSSFSSYFKERVPSWESKSKKWALPCTTWSSWICQ